MYYLNYDNDNIFLEKNNKIILTKYNKFFRFMKVMRGIENNTEVVELNGLNLTNKNTIVIDISSITGVLNVFNASNKIIDEYLKCKLTDFEITFEDEENINNIIEKYLKNIFGNTKEYLIELDYMKILKNNSKLCIDNSNILYEMLETICYKNEGIKHIIIIYKNDILNFIKGNELKNIENNKIIFFEICDKSSNLNYMDNILFFDNEITQITFNEFCELIIEKCNWNFNKVVDNDIYYYLINQILFFSINKKTNYQLSIKLLKIF